MTDQADRPADDPAPSPAPRRRRRATPRARRIHVFYGNIEALKGLSIDRERGEIVTLIGSNGAGKSTTLRAISGTHKPRSRHDPAVRPPDPRTCRLTRS